ncbi:MAG TPA: hypothetical protein VFV57_01800 [Limnobacter sp.]|nr:hypothetical protein [Limnobacter sp.]
MKITPPNVSFPPAHPFEPIPGRRVHGVNASMAYLLRQERIELALAHLLNHPSIQSLLATRQSFLDRGLVQKQVTEALQSYSRSHGVLKLIAAMRERIGSFSRSKLLLDGRPVAMLMCRVHEALEQNGSTLEFSGSNEIGSHEVGRIFLKQSRNSKCDELNRKTLRLEVQVELAPNLYDSPISALVAGLAQDLFLYPKLLEMLESGKSGAEGAPFEVWVNSGLGVPHDEEVMGHALKQVEMHVFELALKAVYKACNNHAMACKWLSQPVADLMDFKARRLRHDASLGLGLLMYLNQRSCNSGNRIDVAELLDFFQGQIRDCRQALAERGAIGRAYFNSQFRNLLCHVSGRDTAARQAEFELRVRAYRELRTEGVEDAPINTSLLNNYWSMVPERARHNAKNIERSSSNDTMVFKIGD